MEGAVKMVVTLPKEIIKVPAAIVETGEKEIIGDSPSKCSND
jgi:hypothetical protein